MTAPASANPVAMCYAESPTVETQTVTVGFAVSAEAPSGPYAIHRRPQGSDFLPGHPSSVPVEDITTESGSADMGSGVESVTIYRATEPCVPLGDWEYNMFNSSGWDVCYEVPVAVASADASCAGVGGSGTGGTAAAGSGGSAAGGDGHDDDSGTDDAAEGCALHGDGTAAAEGLLACLLALGLARRRRRE